MRTFALVVALLLVASVALGNGFSLAEDWNKTYTGLRLYGVAYNPTTNHVIMALGYPSSAGTPQWRLGIFDADTGTDTGNSLQNPAAINDTYFSVACTDDGVIYSYYLWGPCFRWDNESAAPVQLTITGTTASPIRVMKAYGTGTGTSIFVTGTGDDGAAYKLTTTDATLTNWTSNDLTNVIAKSGITAIAPGLNTVYGIQPWGLDETTPNAGFPERFDFSGGLWTRSNTFAPADPFGDDGDGTTTWDTLSLSVGGDYADGALWVFYYLNDKVPPVPAPPTVPTNNDILWGLDGTTGAMVAQYIIPANITFIGSVFADPVNYKIYWGSQISGVENSIYGRLSYTYPGMATPTPAATPTPTPFGFAAASDSWAIYE